MAILPLIRWLRLALEAFGALWIAIGFVYALAGLWVCTVAAWDKELRFSPSHFQPLPVARTGVSTRI